ncbi:MAG: hypothetical protein JW878_10540 [Methanomicrobia archaeon]|nr:hypothetical protein [Methanomicrobia archaeon]
MHVVPEGTPGAMVVGIRKVKELSYYTMGRDQLAQAVKLSKRKTDALIWYLKLKDNETYCKEIPIGKSKYYKYSREAIRAIKDTLKETSLDEIWKRYLERNKI